MRKEILLLQLKVRDKKYLSQNEVFDVFITRETLGLHPGNYYISITIEDYELRNSTTNEKIIREDFRSINHLD